MTSWKHDVDQWPGSLPTLEVNRDRAALLLIDMQNYYIHETGLFRKILKEQFPGMERYFMRNIVENVIPAQKRLLTYFRDENLPIFHVRVGPLLPNGKDQFKRRALRDARRSGMVGEEQALVKGNFQHSVIDELAPLENEFVLDKNSSGAFNSTAIDQLLRNVGAEFLVIGGILTNNCVETTARDAADRGYNVALVEDGCATLNEETQFATYKTFARTYGKVAQSNEIITNLEKSAENIFYW
ncbi:cysteine hydrolase family protein [Salirhabdus salicampi]|uniref:cysteine hydrolase family protein n=1 Tax=Salirhabdus salicampi TaxID=476102 RepID=UPI0020C4966E|nr:isochorismatase family cysteine hydrolase [Salirhabdus salicampi]MCP8615915.1 cysteine hydrolase [Salirhabdus salicampi]